MFGMKEPASDVKGQVISKRFFLAEDSPKKRTNELVFTSMRRVFALLLEESSARKKTFRDYLTFNWQTSFAKYKLMHTFFI